MPTTDNLLLRQTAFAIGTPEEDAATPAEAAAPGATSPLSQVALQKGMLIAIDEVVTALGTGIAVTPSQTDDAAFTPGTTKVMPVAGTYRSSRDTLDDNDAGAIALNAKRGVYVTLEAADSTPLALGNGALSAATLRTVTATDSPEIALLTAIAASVDGLEGATDGLEALIGTTNTTLTAIDGRVDGLETLVGTTNTTLATIDGRVDGLETLVTSTNTKLDTAVGHLDGVEDLIGTTNTTLTAIDGRVDGLETLVTSTNTKLDTAIGHLDGVEGLIDTTNTSLSTIDDAIVADNAGFTDGTTKLDMAGYIFDEVAGTALTENDAAAGRIDSKRAIVNVIEDATTRGQRLAISSAGAASTKEVRASTGTQSNVSGSASSVTILASNANRLGATVYNDSTALLYLLVGSATASSTVHSVQLGSGDYFEVPFNYTGQLTGIWASATGSARVTELT